MCKFMSFITYIRSNVVKGYLEISYAEKITNSLLKYNNEFN